MASYFQSYFQTSSFPKRLLQYALSKLEILDTNALDLENLDIAWGKNSTFEFRDVGLHLEKLDALLHLPPSLEFTKAKVLLLRLTVPVDIFSTPIQVEVEGVESHLRLRSKSSDKPPASSTSRTDHDRIRGGLMPKGSTAGRPTRTGQQQRGPGFNTTSDSDAILPTAQDLAQSFLQTEPEEERAELEAVLLSETQEVGTASMLCDDGDIPMGTGRALSLPAFMAKFLQGIVDRLQIRVHGVLVNLEVEVPSDTSKSMSSKDPVTVQLKIDDIDIERVTQDLTTERPLGAPRYKDGKRLVSLSAIRGCLISEANFFSILSRSSALSSPSTHTGVHDRRFMSKAPSSIRDSVISALDGGISPESSSLGTSGTFSGIASRHGGRSELLSRSIVASDSGRFEDAPEDDNISSLSESARLSDAGESVFQNSAYLDQVTESQYSKKEADSENGSSILDSSRVFKNTMRNPSPLSTPRASIHLSVDVAGTPPDHISSDQEDLSQSMLHSTILPRKQRSRFSDNRVSRSQPALPAGLLSAGQDQILTKDEIAGEEAHDTNDDTGNSTPLDGSLVESQLFSHEDAESMYMSAISHNSSRSPLAPNMTDSSADTNLDLRESSHQNTVEEPLDNLLHARNISPVDESFPDDGVTKSTENVAKREIPPIASSTAEGSNVKPMLHTSNPILEQSEASSDEFSMLSKQFFYLDILSIYLPASSANDGGAQSDTRVDGSIPSSTFDGQGDPSRSSFVDMPGAFSTQLPDYDVPATQKRPIPVPPTSVEGEQTRSSEVEVEFGDISVQFDISIARIAVKLVDQLTEIFKQNETPPSKPESTSDSRLRVNVNQISVKFLERIEGTLASGLAELYDKTAPLSTDVLLRASLKGLRIDSKVSKYITKTSVTVSRFSFGYDEEDILSFDSSLQMGASIRDLAAEAGTDVSIDLVHSDGSTRAEIFTLPIHITIDLQRLDETFSWFGGLSSVLNLGSSIASNTTVTAGASGKPKPRGVRFDAPIHPDDKSAHLQNKADIRFGGFLLELVGADCWIEARTSAVKLVSRDEGIGVTSQKIHLSGPHLRTGKDDPAIKIAITGTRMEFHPSPRAGDLELLLSLITPSKAKYDQDDDILLDTLLRQRKQGSVLRLTFDDFQTTVGRLHELNLLPELGEEISRLGTVAKYLPDDERPGLLSLITVNKFGAQIEVGNDIGALHLASSDISIAQITLPSLIALSVGSLTARRNVSEELLGFGTDPDLKDDRAPCIMARMIGDEMEPVVKLKLYNLKVEYRVTTLIAILGLTKDATPHDISASLAASVATLTNRARSIPLHNERQRHTSSPASKAVAIDVVLRDCILGLNPLGLPSKMLVVLTEARSTIVLPKDGNSNTSLDLNKASLLVVDNVAHLVSAPPTNRGRRQSLDGVQVGDLCAMGYVSVSYISSAKALVTVTRDESGESTIDVELRDDLLVIESCADSTQTLAAVLNGLSPPTPPSKEIKYRTKVIPVHDLLASLSGDAFGTAEGTYNIEDDFEIPDSIEEEEGDDVDLDFDSHYYQGEDAGDDQYNEAILEDEGHLVASMQLTSRDTKDGVLLASFVEPIAPEEPTALDFQEDHFGTGSILEGTAHKWNSAKNTYDRSNNSKINKSPLKVCIRDVHIIWNLFDGYDWQLTRDTIAKAVQDVESKAIEKRARSERRSAFDQDVEDDETVIGDFLFNSIYIGIPAHRDPGDLSGAVNFDINDDTTETESVATTTLSASPSRQGKVRSSKLNKLRLHRSKHHKISFELRGVCVDLVAFPPGSGETQSSIDIRVRDFEIYDHVPTSTWRKFATYMQDAGERETGTSMIHIEMLNVRPVPDLAAAEIVLKATVLPLRLHVDQDALDFITRFFEFKDDSTPVQASTGDPPFLQRVEVNAVRVKLDFKPKRVDYAGLRSGHTTEFMNFIVLDEADMVLRHTIIYGISGFEKLGKCLNDIWMPDIKRNQLPGILAGLAPVRSLVNVGEGLRHLVVVPMREYKKDGRIVRSISKGAAAFAKTTGTELVKLGAKVAIGVQTVLQGAEDFLGPTSPLLDPLGDNSDDEVDSRQISHYANQPVGVLQGLRGGYAGLQRDLVLARDAIIAVPGEIMEGGNAAGVFRAVRKHAPTVILRPAIGVAKAGGQILMGATNSLDPSNLTRAEAKYKTH